MLSSLGCYNLLLWYFTAFFSRRSTGEIIRRVEEKVEPNWNQYKPPVGATVITTLDVHAAGEPLRIVTCGLPPLQGDTILEKRRYMQRHLDYIRRALMWEPR